MTVAHINTVFILHHFLFSDRDMVKRLINSMDFEALEVKMKKCKVFESVCECIIYTHTDVCVCI